MIDVCRDKDPEFSYYSVTGKLWKFFFLLYHGNRDPVKVRRGVGVGVTLPTDRGVSGSP